MANNQLALPPASRGTPKLSPSDKDFKQHLNDNCIYLDVEKPQPQNISAIHEALKRPRRSVSLPSFRDESFERFRKLHGGILNEACVMDIIDILRGNDILLERVTKKNVLFSELEPILAERATRPKPDLIDGAPIDRLERAIRGDRAMRRMLIPASGTNAPAVPNFFLEAKAREGNAAVMEQQACYYAAYGARAMHRLQSYSGQPHSENEGVQRLVYDGNAYTFSCTYHAGTGTLQLYAHHVMSRRGEVPAGRPAYHMTQLGSWPLTGAGFEQFQDGVRAFRNIRDLAQASRMRFVEEANARARGAHRWLAPAAAVQADGEPGPADCVEGFDLFASSPQAVRKDSASLQER